MAAGYIWLNQNQESSRAAAILAAFFCSPPRRSPPTSTRSRPMFPTTFVSIAPGNGLPTRKTAPRGAASVGPVFGVVALRRGRHSLERVAHMPNERDHKFVVVGCLAPHQERKVELGEVVEQGDHAGDRHPLPTSA